MITNTNDGRFRLSSRLTRTAGFKPGDEVAVIRDGSKNIRITSLREAVKNADGQPVAKYHVERDGRLRISRKTIKSVIGVRANRKKVKYIGFTKKRIELSV